MTSRHNAAKNAVVNAYQFQRMSPTDASPTEPTEAMHALSLKVRLIDGTSF